MKKLLFVALAAAGMTACVQNQELAVVKSDAIAFDQFVNNVTKVEDPSYTKDNLQNFQVWGYMEDNTGTVFTGDEVRKSGSAWVYDNIQYWAPGKAYYFEAVAPANGSWTATEATAADITALAFTNNNGTEDLLYTYQEVAARDKATLTNGVAPVQLQFAHLLSKVQFSFKNGFTTDNMTVKVSNVRMTVPAEANVALDTKEWTGHDGDLELAFGAAEATLLANATAYTPAEKALLTIPASASQTYEVKFNVQVLTGAKESLNEEVTSTISGYALEVGKAYNFTAVVGPEVFDLQPIQFNVVGVDAWDELYNGNAAEGKAISTVNELKAALAAGGHYALAADLTVDADETLTVAAGKTVALDLYSHSIVAESDQTGANRNLFDVRGTLSITNTSNELTRNTTGGVISVKHVGTDMEWNASTNVFNVTAGGELNLDGVAVKNLGGSAMAFAVHLNNWGECTLNVDNSTLESTYIAVRVFNSGYDMNNVTIKNSTLKGKFCFWVHNYKAAGDSVGTDETLNFDIFNGTNTFVNTGKAPVLYGFNEPIYYDANGEVYIGQSELDAQSQVENAVVTVSAGEFTLPATIANGVTINGKEGTVLTAPSGISGQNITLNNVTLAGSTSFADGTSATLENCVINRINAQNNNGLNLEFKNCVIGGSVAIQMDLLDGAKASFEGCDIAGWNAFGGTGELTVKNCNFNYSVDYNKLRIYNLDKAEFEGCTFDPNYSIDIKGINGTKNVDIVFNGCAVAAPTTRSAASKNLIELLDLSQLNTYNTASYVIDGTRVNYATTMVKNADELCAITSIKAGQTIILVANIDLAGKEFNGLDTFHPENNTVFDGMGFTVSNWTNESGASDMGFIRNWVGPVKNLTIANAHLKTSGRSAIVAAKAYGNIINCHVVNSTIVDSYWACGLIAGLYNAGNIYNCTVTGSTVESNGGTGGIVGVINESAGTRGFYNCSVSNTTVNNKGIYGEAYSGGLICGMINISNSTVEFEGCAYENNTKAGKYVGDLYYSADADVTVVVK